MRIDISASANKPHWISIRRMIAAITGVLIVTTSLAHAQITLDGSMGVAGALTGPNFLIPSTVGQTRGSNLFHSFGLFNVLTNQSATFSGPNSISNILGRVTGGQASIVDGNIRSTIPNANLYLMNPAGMLFGPNASLDVRGSFHVTTADYLKFADGARFHADLARESVLTTAPVSAFGFLGGPKAAGDITLKGGTSSLSVQPGQSLSLVGGPNTFLDLSFPVGGAGAQLSAPGGQISIAAVSHLVNQSGEVFINAPGLPPSVTPTGLISVQYLTLSGGHETSIAIDQNRNMTIQGEQFIVNGPLIPRNFTVVTPSTGTVTIARAGSVAVEPSASANIETGTLVVNGTLANTSGLPGPIILAAAKSVTVTGTIDASATFTLFGTGGDVIVTSPSVTVADGGSIRSEVAPSAVAATSGGNITLNVGTLSLSGGGAINSSSILGSHGFTKVGSAGTITIQGQGGANTSATSVNIDGASSGVFSQSSTSGAAGSILMNARNFSVSGGAQISSSTFGSGKGGAVTVKATDTVNLAGGSRISSDSSGDGLAGSIEVRARQINLNDGAVITATSSGSGNAGDINIQAHEFRSANSSVTTQADSADGGNIHLTVVKLVYLLNSQITAAVGTGNGGGGNITIDPTFVVLNHSQITANAFGGPGGNIKIVADNFLASTDSTITASSALSTPGTVDIQAPITDLSGSLAPLPESIVQATSLLRQSCATRYSSGKLSSLASSGRGGMPFEPGGFMPSPLDRFSDSPPFSVSRDRSQPAQMLIASAPPRYSIVSPCGKLY